MADKPSRSLIIYGDGHASLLSSSHSHLHSFASRASCGFLSLRNPPPNVPETENDRAIREFAQLLDAYDFYLSVSENHGVSDTDKDQQSSPPTISKRFMGMRAAIFTDCPSVRSFACNLGVNTLQEVPDDTIIASEVLKLLGLSGGDVQEKSEFDLVFLHVGTTGISRNVGWVNKFVGKIMETVQPGSYVASRLHFSIVLSYGSDTKSVDECSLTPNFSSENDSDLYLLRPRQSYTMREGKILKDIRHHHPMLVAQWQEGVTRKDISKKFLFQEFKEHGGNLTILADRFLHEVAFKLWKAPKYGA